MSIYKRYFLKIRRGDLWSSATNGEISANGRAKHAPTEIVRSRFICNMYLFPREEQAPPLPCLIYFGYLCEAITHRQTPIYPYKPHHRGLHNQILPVQTSTFARGGFPARGAAPRPCEPFYSASLHGTNLRSCEARPKLSYQKKRD
jgi:hypothetical protein